MLDSAIGDSKASEGCLGCLDDEGAMLCTLVVEGIRCNTVGAILETEVLDEGAPSDDGGLLKLKSDKTVEDLVVEDEESCAVGLGGVGMKKQHGSVGSDVMASETAGGGSCWPGSGMRGAIGGMGNCSNGGDLTCRNVEEKYTGKIELGFGLINRDSNTALNRCSRSAWS